MTQLKRFVLEGMCYHTISVTRARRPVFSCATNAAILMDAINFVRASGRAYVLAFAILPDHLHLLIMPRSGSTVSDVMKSIKNYTATMINRLRRQHGALWQQSFYDRVIRNEVHLRATLEYIHGNPVLAGLGAKPDDYEYTSANPHFETDLGKFLGACRRGGDASATHS
jgi:REP-associated tyrosine transposase